MDRIKIKLLPILIYIISFYVSLRNANIYLFGEQNAIQSILLDYMFLFLLVITLALILINRMYSKNYYLNGKILIMITLVLWVVIQSLLNSIFSSNNMIPRNLLSGLLAFLVLTLGIKNQKQFNFAFKLFVLGALFSALIPLVKFNGAIGVRTTIYQGVYYPGGLWNSILVSFVSCGWLILASIQKKELKRSYKIFGIIAFSILWLGSFAGVSRTFFLSTMISVFIYALASKNLKKLIQIILIVVIMVVGLESVFPETLTRILSRITDTIGNLAEESRVTIWRTYLSNFSNYYITGAFGNYLKYGPSVISYGTHSVFLNWLVQYGLIGLVGFIMLLIGIVSEVFSIQKQKPKEYSFIVAWLSGYFVQIMISETGFVEASIYVGLSFAILWKKFLVMESPELTEQANFVTVSA